jgi:hypothetical protein
MTWEGNHQQRLIMNVKGDGFGPEILSRYASLNTVKEHQTTVKSMNIQDF